MRRVGYLAAAFGLFAVLVAPLLTSQQAAAAQIAGETFQGVSTAANQWVSGGTPGACLTAATTNASNSIPACGGSPDTVGSGALRLTSAVNNQSGFAFYNTPVSTEDGLRVSFDMYQYGTTTGTGADGISFFLIDGAASPTVPGALGGSLGYSSSDNGNSSGLVGGYVGVGFDRYGNFSASNFGTGGTGRLQNSIAVRGSEDSGTYGYQFVTNTPANGSIANDSADDRADAKRHVVVSISTNNVMTVQVDYNNGQGLQTELSGLDLNTINGEGTLPPSFKFGFAASTGGSNNIHEVSGLSIDPLDPILTIDGDAPDGFQQDEITPYEVTVGNDAGGQPTVDSIAFSATLPSGLKPVTASGSGWTCSVQGQQVHCARAASGGDALLPGQTAPVITLGIMAAEDAPASRSIALTATTPSNGQTITAALNDTVTVDPSSDTDKIADSIEQAAPNGGDANDDGDTDADQETVTSLPNPVTGKYAVLETTGCTGNSDVTVAAQQAGDTRYTYPAGLVDFKLTCPVGATATVQMYFFGLAPTNLVLRKYNPVTQTYSSVADAVFNTVTIGGQQATKVSYQITDGGPLDTDGTANGTILDPAGPAVLSASVAAPQTGLAGGSVVPYAIAVLAALGLVGLELRRSYRAQPSAKLHHE